MAEVFLQRTQLYVYYQNQFISLDHTVSFWHETSNNSLQIYADPYGTNPAYQISNFAQFQNFVNTFYPGYIDIVNFRITDEITINYPFCLGVAEWNYRNASVIPEKHYPFCEQYLVNSDSTFCNLVICDTAITSIVTVGDDGSGNGSVTITASATPVRNMGFWFSIDGVNFYKNLVDGVYEYTFTGLVAGTYDITVKQGDWAFDLIGTCFDTDTFTIDDLSVPVTPPNERWYIDYDNFSGVTKSLKIYDYLYTGSPVKVNASRMVVSRKLGNQNDDLFNLIKYSQADIEFYADSNYQFFDLFTSDPMRFKVEHRTNGILDWTMFCVTDIYLEPYTTTPYLVNFTAIDNLKILENIDFELVRNTNLLNYTPVKDCIFYILNKTGLPLDVWYMEAVALYANDLYGYVFGNKIKNEWFFNDDLSNKNCLEVLQAILNMFNLRLFQNNNKWYLTRFQDLKINSATNEIIGTTSDTITLNTFLAGTIAYIKIDDYFAKFEYTGANNIWQVASGEPTLSVTTDDVTTYTTDGLLWRKYDITGAYLGNEYTYEMEFITNPIVDVPRCQPFVGSSQTLEILPASKSLKLVNDFGYKDNILRNSVSKLSDWDGSVLQGWNGTAQIFRTLTDAKTGEYGMTILGNNLNREGQLYQSTFFNAYTNQLDKFKLSFEYMVDGNVETDEAYKNIYWMFKVLATGITPNPDVERYFRNNRTGTSIFLNGWAQKTYAGFDDYYKNILPFKDNGKWEKFELVFSSISQDALTGGRVEPISLFELALFQQWGTVDNPNLQTTFKNVKLELIPNGQEATKEELTLVNSNDGYNYISEDINLNLSNVADYNNAILCYKNTTIQSDLSLFLYCGSPLLEIILPLSQIIMQERWYFYQKQRRVIRGVIKSYKNLEFWGLFIILYDVGTVYILNSIVHDDTNNTYEVELTEFTGYTEAGTPDINYYRRLEDFSVRKLELTPYRQLEY